MKRRVYTLNQLGGYHYEVNFRTKTDGKALYVKWKSDLNLSDSLIENVFNTVCDCYIHSIKRIKYYESFLEDSNYNSSAKYGLAFRLRYWCSGFRIRTASFYLPYVFDQFMDDDLLAVQLEKIFGSDLEISSKSPRA